MTRQRRWSERLEAQRAGTEAAAAQATALLDDAQTRIARARSCARTNPDLADRLLADAQLGISQAIALQERIQRLMVEARYGLE